MGERGAEDPQVLALDQGGHASRARVYDADGAVVAAAEVPVSTRHPGPGRVEHDADELADSLSRCIRQLAAELGPEHARVRAAGLATQRSTIVCWDRMTGEALSPAISWQDVRAPDRLEALDPGRTSRITGLRPSPHYGASKLAWCLTELPEVGEAMLEGRLAWGPLASFLLHRLCTERPYLTDPANGSRTLLMDMATLDWSPELCEAFGIPEATLPVCVPNRYPFGHLKDWGTPLSLSVCTGDQSAALFASGEPAAETVYINIGTGAFLQRPVAGRPSPAEGLLASVVWADGETTRHVREATVNGAGAALRWLARETGQEEPALLTDLEASLEAVDHQDPGLMFLNGVGGLASPWWVPDFVPRFTLAGDATEEGSETDGTERLAAVAESIVFIICRCLETLEAADGPVDALVVSGGMAASDGLCQRLADLSGRPVRRPEVAEATSRGLAARVAGRDWPVADRHRFEPTDGPGLRERYQRWRDAMEQAVVEMRAGE